MWTANPGARALLASLSVLIGCASPIKPATLDKSGQRMTHAVVDAKLRNEGGNPKLGSPGLSAGLAAAFPEQARRLSEGGLRVSTLPGGAAPLLERAKSVPGATHAIAVDADDSSDARVTEDIARATLRALKEAGLF